MARKRPAYVEPCTHPGCTNAAQVTGLCLTHRAATQSPTGQRPRVLERRLETWHRQWAEIRRLAQEIHDAGETILAAGEQTAADAYPSSLRGQEGRGAGDHADPTLATTERDAGGTDDQPDTWTAPPDAVAEWVRELTLVSTEVRGHMRRLGRLASMVTNRHDPRVGDIGGNCKACGRYCSGAVGDRLRTLYCNACYQAWLTWSAARTAAGVEPIHHLFEKERREQLEQGAA